MISNFGVILGVILFSIGCTGFMVRRNAIVIFLSLEIMVNGAILSIISFGAEAGVREGMVMGFFIIAVAAAEAVVGLAIILRMYRMKGSIDISLFTNNAA